MVLVESNMIYDHRNLQNKDLVILKDALEKYKDHDKLDLIIEITLDNSKKEKIKNGKKSKVNYSTSETTEAIPEALKFCDGDSCQVSYSDA